MCELPKNYKFKVVVESGYGYSERIDITGWNLEKAFARQTLLVEIIDMVDALNERDQREHRKRVEDWRGVDTGF